MTKLHQALIAVAIAMQKDHILWEINNIGDTWGTKESRNEYDNIQAELKEATDAYIAAGGMVTNRSIIGELTGKSGLSHYDIDDIDDAVSAKFPKDAVQSDSESGGLYIYMDKSVVDTVEEFLTKNYPDLSFGVHVDDNDSRPITLCNWNEGKRILDDAGVTVDYAPKITIPLKDDDEINSLVDQAAKALLLTGVASEEQVEAALKGFRESTK